MGLVTVEIQTSRGFGLGAPPCSLHFLGKAIQVNLGNNPP